MHATCEAALSAPFATIAAKGNSACALQMYKWQVHNISPSTNCECTIKSCTHKLEEIIAEFPDISNPIKD